MAWRNKLKEMEQDSDEKTDDKHFAREEEDLKAIGIQPSSGAIRFSLDKFKEPTTPEDDVKPKNVLPPARQDLPPPPRKASAIKPLTTSNSSQNLGPIRALPVAPVQQPDTKPSPQTPPTPVQKPSSVEVSPQQSSPPTPVQKPSPPPPVKKPSPPLEKEQDISETELLKQQVNRLQLRNQELQEEAQKSSSLRLSQSLYDAIENQDEITEMEDDIVQIASAKRTLSEDDPFDDYFHVIGSNYASKIVTSVSDGLCACDVGNIIPKYDGEDWYGYEYDMRDLHEREENAYCQMHRIRSLEDKSVLLKNLTNDPIASVPVVHWCEQTLSFQNFMGLLGSAENAHFMRTYIGHLKSVGDLKQLSRVYTHRDMAVEECMLRIKHALLVQDLSAKLDAIHDCMQFLKANQDRLKQYCQKNNVFDISSYGDMLMDAHSLLSRQINIDRYDAGIASQGKEIIYLEHPRYNITGTTLSISLQYCLFYHPYADDNKLSSPRAMAKQFKLSQHRYIYEGMHTRARIGDWKAVHHLYEKAKQANLCYMSAYEFHQLQTTTGVAGFLKKKLNTGSKDSYSVLAVNNFLSVALEYNAPLQFLEVLLNELEKPEERFELAKTRQVWSVAIKCAAHDLKDKDLLQALRNDILEKMSAEESAELRQEIDQLLHGNKIKWKKGGRTESSSIFSWFK
jgi:hypothetical protein